MIEVGRMRPYPGVGRRVRWLPGPRRKGFVNCEAPGIRLGPTGPVPVGVRFGN